MLLNFEKEGNIYIICPDGDLDASNAVQMDDAMAEALKNNEKIIAIDCSKLNYISSAGLGVFISYINELEQKNIPIYFFNMSDKIKHVFDMVGIAQLVKIVNLKSEII